jgi:hypothetical protein
LISTDGVHTALGFRFLERATVYNSDGSVFGGIPSPEAVPIDFGYSVAIAGDLVIVGAPNAPGGGAAYVYRLEDVMVPEAPAGLLAMTALSSLVRPRQRGVRNHPK